MPLDVTQCTVPELRAGVEAAENWGTYGAVHAYTSRAVRQALEAGVKSIEHGQLIDEPTPALLPEKGAWCSLHPILDDEDALPFAESSANRKPQLDMSSATDNAYELSKRYKVKTAWGTDTLFDTKLASRQGAQLSKLTRPYTPAEVSKMATADNTEPLALSGLRHPYEGKLGLVQEGALADLLLVDGDPIANIKLIEDPAKNFVHHEGWKSSQEVALSLGPSPAQPFVASFSLRDKAVHQLLKDNLTKSIRLMMKRHIKCEARIG
jgi:imidazolonepropionase-like amidohydrolase